MKKTFKSSMMGVTLLEVMLVLAIAAMIIVMSVRYYQSTVASQQTNATLSQITAIVAAADALSQATGSYANIDTASITAVVPANSMTASWGQPITMGTSGVSSFIIQIEGMPANVCPLVKARLEANAHFTTLSICGGAAADFNTTYISNP
jgi:type II secretory pathway pseudopilin PulG